MTTQRQGTGNRLASPATQRAVKKYPAAQFPIQREIRRLEDDLSAFNERMAELEDDGHRGHAMDVLKANAIDFARRIDELRCLLVVPTKKGEPS